MKKEFLIQRTLVLGYISVLIIGVLYLAFLLIFKSNTSFDNMAATTHNMMTFFVVVGLTILIMFTPAVMISNDNKYIYFNTPMAREKILYCRYKSSAVFFLLGLTVLFILLLMIYYAFNSVGLNDHASFDIYIDAFYSKPFVSILFIFVNFKVIFTIYYFKDLSNLKYKTLIFYLISIPFMFIQLSMFMFILMDSVVENSPLVTYIYLNIGFVFGSLIADKFVFAKGEI